MNDAPMTVDEFFSVFELAKDSYTWRVDEWGLLITGIPIGGPREQFSALTAVAFLCVGRRFVLNQGHLAGADIGLSPNDIYNVDRAETGCIDTNKPAEPILAIRSRLAEMCGIPAEKCQLHYFRSLKSNDSRANGGG